MAEKTEGVTVRPAGRAERVVSLGSLKPGDTFRLQGTTYEQAIGADDPGGCFYRVMTAKKEGLVKVLSLDCANERMLPQETPVHQHHITIEVHPSQQ